MVPDPQCCDAPLAEHSGEMDVLAAEEARTGKTAMGMIKAGLFSGAGDGIHKDKGLTMGATTATQYEPRGFDCEVGTRVEGGMAQYRHHIENLPL